MKNRPAKTEPVSKAAPKIEEKPKVVEKAASKLSDDDEWGTAPTQPKEVTKAAVEKTESDYSADWGENDLEDKSAPASKPVTEVKPISIPEKSTIPPATTVATGLVGAAAATAVVAAPKFEEAKPEKIDFFGQNNDMDDELADLEKEFNKNEQAKKSNPLGNSITKEMLQQSKKEIDQDGFDIEDDFFEEKKQGVKAAAPVKKNLEIAIDDNADYEMENN